MLSGIVLLILGLLFAIFGADILVNGASAIAKRFKIPPLVIGAVIVGFGTSMPELTVNVVSALKGHTDIAISNILGSNIFNILLILGVAAWIHPLVVKKISYQRDMPMNLLAAIMVGVCGNEILLDGFKLNRLIPSDGIVFLAFFCIYMYYTFLESVDGEIEGEIEPEVSDDEPETTVEPGINKSIAFVVLGMAGLVGGGELIVNGAVGIAKIFKIEQHIIGLLIIGPGTSFPELIASGTAALRKKTDLAVGNIVGSNIFNIFFTLGVTALIKPVPLKSSLNIAVGVTILASLLLFLFSLGRGHRIGRVKGTAFILIYIAYIAYML